MMLKTLLKKQLLELNRGFFYNTKKNTVRSRASSILLIALYALLMVGIIGGMFTFMAIGLCRPLVEMGMDWLYYALIILIAVFMGVFGSVFNTYSSLYKAKDNDLLLSLPVPVGNILVARLTGVYLMGLMFSAVVMVPAVVVYLTVAPGAGAVIGGVVLTLLVSVFVLELSCVLGWVVAKISTKIRHKSIITVLLSLGFLALYYFVYFNAYELLGSIMTNADQLGRSIRGWGYPLYLMGRGAMGEVVPLLVVLVVVAALLAVIYRVLSHSFLKMATASDKTVKVKYREKAARARSVRRALLGRETSRYLASPTYMLNCSLGTLFLPIMAVLALVKGRDVFLMLGAVFAGGEDFVAVLTALMLWRPPAFVQLALAAAVLFGAGAALWRGTWRALRGGSLGPDAPGLLAALILFAYSTYAAFAGLQPCFPALCGIVCAQLAGKYAAQLARGTLAAPVQRLRHLRPRTAAVVRGGAEVQADADALTPQDVVRIVPGERIPVDGIVCSGVCTVDESALTGASRPVEKTVGDAVLTGTLDRAGSASVTPTAVGDATVLQRTIAALQRAQTVRTPERERLERAASRMTALLIILAAGVGAVWLFRRQSGDLARALTCACGVLAAACPGAAGQAAGVAALAGIGRAAERGELLMHGAEASAAQTARTVRRGIWLLLAYHAVCLPLAACGVIGPAAAAVLACGASGGVMLYALRGNGTKGERP